MPFSSLNYFDLGLYHSNEYWLFESKPLPEPMLTNHQWGLMTFTDKPFSQEMFQDIFAWYEFENHKFKITATSPMCGCVKSDKWNADNHTAEKCCVSYFCTLGNWNFLGLCLDYQFMCFSGNGCLLVKWCNSVTHLTPLNCCWLELVAGSVCFFPMGCSVLLQGSICVCP